MKRLWIVLPIATACITVFNYSKTQVSKQALRESLESCSNERLLKMYDAGLEVLEWNHIFEEAGSHAVKELIQENTTFHQMEHYPKGSVYDRETHAQYYYHIHRQKEHGHFHLFLRYPGVNGTDAFSHLIAISMDDKGAPIKIFTTNRWVTGEDWAHSEDVCLMVDQFQFNRPHSSWMISKWLSSLLQFFYPQVIELIFERDLILLGDSRGRSLEEVREDKALETLSEKEISIDVQMEVLKAVIDKRGIEIAPF